MRAHAGPARAAAFCGWVVMGGCLAVCLPFFFPPLPFFVWPRDPHHPTPGLRAPQRFKLSPSPSRASWHSFRWWVTGGCGWWWVGEGGALALRGRCVFWQLAFCLSFSWPTSRPSLIALAVPGPPPTGVQIAHNDGPLGFLSSGSRDGSGLPWRGQARCGSRGYSKDPAILALQVQVPRLRLQKCCTQGPPPSCPVARCCHACDVT